MQGKTAAQIGLNALAATGNLNGHVGQSFVRFGICDAAAKGDGFHGRSRGRFAAFADDDVAFAGEIGYNVMTGSVNAFTAVTIADVVDTFTVHDNYYAGANLAFGGVRGGPGDSSSKTSWSNNTNMATGAVSVGP